MLLLSAGVASFYIFLDKGSHAGPPELALNTLICCMDARVSRGGVVVTLLEDFAFEFIIWWYIDPSFVVDQAVDFFPFSKSVEEAPRSFVFECC
jgi:hypothetical protein